MGGVSLSLDTTQLAEAYEARSTDRQFRNGQRLVARLGIVAGDRVLDVGSGTGLLAEHVANLVGSGGSVLGIDPLPLRIAIAERRRRSNLAFAVGNAYELDALPSGTFDVVYLNAVFHWLPEKAGPLGQIHRLLKPGGRVGISTGSREHPNRIQQIKKRVLSRPPFDAYPAARDGEPNRVSPDELRELLRGAGFVDIQIDLEPNAQLQPSAEAAIEFSDASSFGNYLGHLPAELRSSAVRQIKEELESLRTPEGIRLDGTRIIAVARKSNDRGTSIVPGTVLQ
jgi:ubiquinone/menaquinone biosynthesis C-methylase UbiE